MGTRNNDISLILAKAKRAGFFEDVQDSEIDYLARDAKDMFFNDSSVSSGPDICKDGDSLNAQGGGLNPAVSIGAHLARFTERTVHNNAVGGETSQGIAARQGGAPYILLPVGNVIPASGGVVVTIVSPTNTWPLLQTAGNPALGQVFVGTFAGVLGTITLTQPTTPGSAHQSDDYYTFTRLSAGAEVPVTRPMPFYTSYSMDRRGDIHIIDAGTNNSASLNQVLSDIEAMINFLDAAHKKYLIIGLHTGTGEGNPSTAYTNKTAINTELSRRYGRRYVDKKAYLISYGLADLSINPTANDLADIAADTTPRSLLTDTLHFTVDAREVIARLEANRLFELGWVPDTGKTLLVSDNFDRADSSNIGPLWDTNTNFSIISNKLSRTTVTGTPAIATLKQVFPDDQQISAVINRGTATSTGLILRYIDDNNYYGCRLNQTLNNILIYRVVGGVTTSMSGLDNQWTAENSTLTFKAKGSTFSALINGVEVLSTSSTHLLGGVKVGVRASSEGATKSTIDFLTAKPVLY